jgi:hypothetical protein
MKTGTGPIPGTHKLEVRATEEVPSKTGGEPERKFIVPERFASFEISNKAVTVPPEGSTELKIAIP